MRRGRALFYILRNINDNIHIKHTTIMKLLSIPIIENAKGSEGDDDDGELIRRRGRETWEERFYYCNIILEFILSGTIECDCTVEYPVETLSLLWSS